jgi:hypothetical protein
MIEPLRTGHPLSAFEKVIVSGKEISRARLPQGERWEMERALYVLEELLETEETARRKGLAVMIDWWAPRFMICEAPELREKFAEILIKAYHWRHLLPLAPVTVDSREA